MPWEEVKQLLHLVAKNEDVSRRFLGMLQGIEIPQQVFDPEEIPEGMTSGQMAQRKTAMQKARALREKMRQERQSLN